ncbi:helix-turn-helix domain-containing protein [Yinghuangia sp. YIM S10712]|uniref:helix-turn-helix domain-containing protein n=1 Tax=Yinghuangia sp. YIM S10712 TaxID=3436930 RepID=UPI003F5341B6
MPPQPSSRTVVTLDLHTPRTRAGGPNRPSPGPALQARGRARTFPTATAATPERLAGAAGMTQSAVARFEAGGTVPTIPVLERLARALDVELVVRFATRSSAA